MKNLFLGVLSAFILIGCASRKVDRDKSTTTTQTQTDTQKAVDSTAVHTSNIDYHLFSKKLILRPIDTTRAMFWNGQEIKNATAEFEEKTDTTKVRNKDTVIKKLSTAVKVKSKIVEQINKKITERQAQTGLFLYLIIAGLIVYILYGIIIRKNPLI